MTDDSLLSIKTHCETWDDFGKSLEDFITYHKTELEEESYDLILAFSRGGTIFAFAFACLLKDKSSEYSKPNKASVRSIPRGITVKIDDPCFVMDHPASRLEKEDITNNLKEDLEDFSKKFNGGKPPKVLVMDDNLTGATRVKFLENELIELEKAGLVIGHSTLAYVRHKAFLENEIPTIIPFPKDKDIFVMPWHIPHPPRELNIKDSHAEMSRLVFRIKLKCDFETFMERVKANYGFEEGFIFNGASNFFINNAQYIAPKIVGESPQFVEISHFPNKLYPPKMCLASDEFNHRTNNNDNEFHSLCSYLDDITIDVCTTCSCLNCNSNLIRNLLLSANSGGGGEISIKTVFRNKENLRLREAIEKWFRECMPDVAVIEYD